jgi:preprotein translocase subunit YajC
MHRAQLVGRQIFVMMAFIGPRPKRKQAHNRNEQGKSLHGTPR